MLSVHTLVLICVGISFERATIFYFDNEERQGNLTIQGGGGLEGTPVNKNTNKNFCKYQPQKIPTPTL